MYWHTSWIISGMSNKTIMKNFLIILISVVLVSQAGKAQNLNLTQFNAEALANRSTLLEWKTMMEMKVDYYIIQRGTDAIQFQNIGRIDSKMNDSTKAYELQYDYTDQSPLPGISYYRLQIVDRSGFSKYSDVVMVTNDDQVHGIKIFPTLVQNTNFFVETDKTLKNAKLELFDLSGKKISETEWASLSGRQILQAGNNKAYVATGTYVAHLTANGQTVMNQILIIQAH